MLSQIVSRISLQIYLPKGLKVYLVWVGWFIKSSWTTWYKFSRGKIREGVSKQKEIKQQNHYCCWFLSSLSHSSTALNTAAVLPN